MIASDTVPAESLYWVRLPPSPRRWTRDRIIAGIEAWIPADPDHLDLAWVRAADGGAVAVAIEPERLDALLTGRPASWTLVPDRVPEHVAVAGVAAAELNLLTGRRTPAPLRRARQLIAVGALAAGLACAVLLVVGGWRRHVAAAAAVETARTAGERVVAEHLPQGLGGADPDPLVRLDQARRMADSLRQAVGTAQAPPAELFAALLAAWPVDVRTQVAACTIDGQRCTIAGTAPTVADAQRLAGALATALADRPGWRMLPLQAGSIGGTVSFTCTLVREGP